MTWCAHKRNFSKKNLVAYLRMINETLASFSCSQGLKKCPALFQKTKYKWTKQKTLANPQNRLIQEKSAFFNNNCQRGGFRGKVIQ
jgi:hypothetical protein